MPFSGIGFGEMLMIALIVLVVFGPRRLPEISRSMGKAIREFKRGMNEIQRELQVAEREERWKSTRPVGSGAGSSAPPAGATPAPAADAPPAGATPSADPRPGGGSASPGADPGSEATSARETPPSGGAGPTIASPDLSGPRTQGAVEATSAVGAAIGPWGSSATPDDLSEAPEPDARAESGAKSGTESGTPEGEEGTEEDPLQSDLFSGDPA